jgi:hypothetical protein
MAANTRPLSLPAVLSLGFCLLLGLGLAGYAVGEGLRHQGEATRTVTVKGLVEQEVKADRALWSLNFRRAGAEPETVQRQLEADRSATVEFLHAQGFVADEISRQPIRTVDKLAREYGETGDVGAFRYVATSAVLVDTKQVDRVTQALGRTETLLSAGVLLDGDAAGGANPRYLLGNFNALRPSLLAAATKNARETAQQFAADASTQVGRIRDANQGAIQIFGSDGNNESSPYSPTSTPVKTIRVVSTFEFELD